MKTGSFIRQYDFVFDWIQTLVQRKGYALSNCDYQKGTISARKKESKFKSTELIIKISKIDPTATGLKLMINNNEKIAPDHHTADGQEEQMLMETITASFLSIT